MAHPMMMDVLRSVLRERGVCLGHQEEECLRMMVERLQEVSGVRLIPWLAWEEIAAEAPSEPFEDEVEPGVRAGRPTRRQERRRVLLNQQRRRDDRSAGEKLCA
jgi:hypothetical protein